MRSQEQAQYFVDINLTYHYECILVLQSRQAGCEISHQSPRMLSRTKLKVLTMGIRVLSSAVSYNRHLNNLHLSLMLRIFRLYMPGLPRLTAIRWLSIWSPESKSSFLLGVGRRLCKQHRYEYSVARTHYQSISRQRHW